MMSPPLDRTTEINENFDKSIDPKKMQEENAASSNSILDEQN